MQTLVYLPFGSHLYGTQTAQSDRDYKGIYLPTLEQLYLQRIPKSLRQDTKDGSARKNTAADVDSELYSLHYFLELACRGEMIALDMLHSRPDQWLTVTETWKDLVVQRQRFYTKNLAALCGYVRQQAAKYGIKGSRLAEAQTVLDFLRAQGPHTRIEDVWDLLPTGDYLLKGQNEVDAYFEVCGKKLTGRTFCHHHVPTIQVFVDQYGSRARQAERNEGVDWKAMSHALRAAYQVIAILRDGGYVYPLPQTEEIRAVKEGRRHFTREVAPVLETLMDTLEQLQAHSTLPDTVDRAYWDRWLVDRIDRLL